MAVRGFLTLSTLSFLLLLTPWVIPTAEHLPFETVSVDGLQHSTGKTVLNGLNTYHISFFSVYQISQQIDLFLTPTVVVGKTSTTKEVGSAPITSNSHRVATLQKRVRDEPSVLGHDASAYPKAGLDVGTSNYAVTFEFGNPTLTQTVIIDTSSDLSWVQCAPCMETCYLTNRLIVYPLTSSTYHNLSSESSHSIKLPSSTRFNGTTCGYGVGYGDNVYSFGFPGRDTLRLPSGERLDDFIFGCGHNDQGFSSGYSGLIGMGRGAYSLNSQFAPRVANIFSYCLPSQDSTNGFLQFGKPPRNLTEYTPMLTSSRAPSLYFLNLTGITVGGKKKDLSPSVFHSAGTIIDSATEITHLPPDAYSALKTAFRANMTKYPLTEASRTLKTCYDFSKFKEVTYPAIWFHFDGLDLKMPPSGVFYSYSSAQYCLSFVGNSNVMDVGIIGTLQRKLLMTTVNQRIGFGYQACN